jgi:hypothetical protein
MTGKVLGFETAQNEGVISSDDGKRYKFTKSQWKESSIPQKEMRVDFDIGDGDIAGDIYIIRDKDSENSEVMMGLLSVGLTLFLGFVGTFISRLVLSKQPFGKTILPTAIHFIFTIMALVPIFGWILYLIGTIYYMVKNYKLVTTDSYVLANKYGK